MAYNIKATIVNREVKLNPNILGSVMTLGFGVGLSENELYKEKIMYKKITHTITEEHFAHPMAVEIKKIVDINKVNPKPKLSTPSSIKFQTDVKNYFTNYASKMHNLIGSVFNNTLASAEEDIFKDVDNLGNMLMPIYGFDVAQRINEVMRGYVLAVVNSAKNVRDNLDTLNEKNINNMLANQLARVLNSINNSWQYAIVRDAFLSLFDSWVQEAKAINKKDIQAANTAFSTVNQTITSFADILANGIIQQNPDQFST